MPIDRDRVARARTMYFQCQNVFIDQLNDCVCPRGASKICLADVVKPKKPVDDLLRLVKDFFDQLQDESDKSVPVPYFFRGRDRFLHTSQDDVAYELRLCSLGYWKCTLCGKIGSKDEGRCSKCETERDAQLEKVSREEWKNDFVDPMDEHLDNVGNWFDQLSQRMPGNPSETVAVLAQHVAQSEQCTNEAIEELRERMSKHERSKNLLLSLGGKLSRLEFDIVKYLWDRDGVEIDELSRECWIESIQPDSQVRTINRLSTRLTKINCGVFVEHNGGIVTLERPDK